MPESPQPWVTIGSEELSASINPHGAQLSRLSDGDGRDLLWDGDPAVWSGRAPLLFPIVGVLAGGSYRLGPDSYRLSRHGFARDKHFTLVEADAGAALLRLRADPSTLQIYPFDFDLEVRFEVAGPMLTVTGRIRNQSERPLFASFGFHPALRWPLPFGERRESHFIEFETEESAPVRRLDAAGLLTPTLHPNPVKRRRLALDDALFVDDALIFDRLTSRSVVYGDSTGARLRVDFPDAPYLGIWSKPGARFICIEPWHGITDPVGFTGDFTQKPGVFAVPAGGQFSTSMAISLVSSEEAS